MTNVLDGPLEVGCFLPPDSYDSTNAAFSAGSLSHHACVVKCFEDGKRIAVIFNVSFFSFIKSKIFHLIFDSRVKTATV